VNGIVDRLSHVGLKVQALQCFQIPNVALGILKCNLSLSNGIHLDFPHSFVISKYSFMISIYSFVTPDI
jgi:hypothetical protein